MKKITTVLCIIFAVIMVLSLPISAATPYYTYTYSIAGVALRSPDAYVPDREVDADYMELTNVNRLAELYPDLTEEQLAEKAALKMTGLTDLEVDENENVYIVDRDNNRIIVLDPYYKLKFIIDNFTNINGNIDSLKAPEGVFVSASKTIGGEYIDAKIYVCDTGNARILTFDTDGNFISEIGKPQSELIDASSVYMPVAVAVDRYDRLYVVDRNSGNGIVVMTDTGEFTGYIGAQKVSVSLWDKIWSRFQTEDQKELNESAVSTAYNNIALAGDFIYVTISPNEEGAIANAIRNKDKSGDNAPVKLLNAAGKELMRRNGFYPPSGEVDFEGTVTAEDGVVSGPSKVVDVAVGPEDTWSIIDQKRSKVFTYDFDGNLLFAFGDGGQLLGNITLGYLNAISYQGTAMLMLDSAAEKGSFTVYQRTEYGDVLIKALENQNNRRYDAAIDDWTEVLKRNSNFDAAYIGIGKSLYRNHDYKGAVEQYKSAYDTENYSIAYSEIRQQWISSYLWTIPLILAVLIAAFWFIAKKVTKINKRAETSTKKRTFIEELVFAFHLILHPFDGFWDLKHEKRGSVRAGTTILAVTIFAFYYQSVGAGYVSNPQMNYLSLIGALTSVAVPLALWVIGNWCVTTLFDGEGSLKDIYIASTYSLVPLILTIIPTTIASNFLLASELKMVTLFTTIGFVWLGLLLFFGMMVTHDYGIGKNVIATLGTLLAMVFIMFLALLFSTLLGKLVSFVTNIVTELQYRM